MIISCNPSNFPFKINKEDVEENPFYEKLSLCVGTIYQNVSEAHKGEDNFFKYFDTSETYANDIYMLYRSVESCLDSINYAISFISRYGTKDYMRKDFVPFDKFCLYHFDVICHKVSTLKDLYFKIVNKVYKIGLEKPTWNALRKYKDEINNEHLFSILEANFSLMEAIDNKRNESSHEGNIRLSILNDLSLYLMASSFHEKVPNMEYDWKYEKGSIVYKNQIKKAKKEMLDYLNVVKYNAFIVTKCFMCSLAPQLEILLKELFPNISLENDKLAVSRISCTMPYCKNCGFKLVEAGL